MGESSTTGHFAERITNIIFDLLVTEQQASPRPVVTRIFGETDNEVANRAGSALGVLFVAPHKFATFVDTEWIKENAPTDEEFSEWWLGHRIPEEAVATIFWPDLFEQVRYMIEEAGVLTHDEFNDIMDPHTVSTPVFTRAVVRTVLEDFENRGMAMWSETHKPVITNTTPVRRYEDDW